MGALDSLSGKAPGKGTFANYVILDSGISTPLPPSRHLFVIWAPPSERHPSSGDRPQCEPSFDHHLEPASAVVFLSAVPQNHCFYYVLIVFLIFVGWRFLHWFRLWENNKKNFLFKKRCVLPKTIDLCTGRFFRRSNPNHEINTELSQLWRLRTCHYSSSCVILVQGQKFEDLLETDTMNWVMTSLWTPQTRMIVC